ncbi:MAG: bifunctional (p)ppGpp synthetase/guanosine-3',5'-bis(diphosphate) 3'-pyrophosphohydrolase [Lachnospiraceae bacterium]|nr:bifunctional (p)ppGpp synthetase/guanosine-3',5'-bis(diphosphate) 3'-pyrophosphohydrolase [Lachnospiraceae bacterium]
MAPIENGKDREFVIDDGRIESLGEYLSPDELYRDLITRVEKYHPSDDISMIERAYKIADEAHNGQVRKSGEPYIVHPLNVAIILADLELDKETIVAGILHDVVEDTIFTKEEIAAEFGDEVALLVDGVTKLQHFTIDGAHVTESTPKDKIEVQAENLRKMFLAMAKDIRVIMIKLADRLHNMRTLFHMPPEKQQRIAQETLDIYSPIADRLGISKIKVELDDLSLKYLHPDVYADLTKQIGVRKVERERYIQGIVNEVSAHIFNAGIEATIDGRVKHFFSIYKKMVNQHKTIDQIYDLFAVRIIVRTVRDCYAALGIIHEIYKPIPGRFKDYIAMPKPNMYQSLHTTLIGSSGQPFEIQIRTYEMHKAAEYGIAAHWKYKENSDGKTPDNQEEEKLAWLRQILEWQRDMSDNKEFMEALKSDLDMFSDSVYCFTPTGEVKNLPAGSNPIDFAYAIHSAVGNRMVGARVNGQLVPIDYVINNGDRIEIITSQNSKGPSRDWLSIVKSGQARNKISQWFKQELKEENITRGKELILDYCKSKGINVSNISKPEYKDAVLRKYGFHDWDSVYAAIGHGGVKEGQIVNKLIELYEADHRKNMTDEEILEAVNENAAKIDHRKSGPKSGIIVKGMDDLSVRFSKCCSPVPGDEIVGFVTRGRGISVHRSDCVNLAALSEHDRGRIIEAEWQHEEENKGKYNAEIMVYAADRKGLLADLSKILTENNISISTLNTRINKQGMATMNVSFEIESREALIRLTEKLRSIPNVVDVERTKG